MNDNFWNNIETKKKSFTSKELEVCELLEEDPFSFAASTATEISKRYECHKLLLVDSVKN